MKDFFKGTSLGEKAEIKEFQATINSLPIDRLTAKEKKTAKHKLFEMKSDYIDFRKAHVIINFSDIANSDKLVYTCATYKAVSEKMKEIFDSTPYWRIDKDCGDKEYKLKEKADETEIDLYKGLYRFTFNPEIVLPSLFLKILSLHGNEREQRNAINILEFYKRQIKKSKGQL